MLYINSNKFIISDDRLNLVYKLVVLTVHIVIEVLLALAVMWKLKNRNDRSMISKPTLFEQI